MCEKKSGRASEGWQEGACDALPPLRIPATLDPPEVAGLFQSKGDHYKAKYCHRFNTPVSLTLE